MVVKMTSSAALLERSTYTLPHMRWGGDGRKIARIFTTLQVIVQKSFVPLEARGLWMAGPTLLTSMTE